MSELAAREIMEMLPVLPSLDIDETLAFYRDKLGFDQIGYKDHDYLIIWRMFADQRLELHFWKTDERHLCENSGAYVRGRAVDLLHMEFSERQVPKLTPLKPRPWGMEEFYVWDPHGNLLKFGRRVE